MKKVLFLFSMVVLCSCISNSDGSDTLKSEEGEVPAQMITEFKYKKHTYIMFSKGYGAGVVHDPECQYCYDKFN